MAYGIRAVVRKGISSCSWLLDLSSRTFMSELLTWMRWWVRSHTWWLVWRAALSAYCGGRRKTIARCQSRWRQSRVMWCTRVHSLWQEPGSIWQRNVDNPDPFNSSLWYWKVLVTQKNIITGKDNVFYFDNVFSNKHVDSCLCHPLK